MLDTARILLYNEQYQSSQEGRAMAEAKKITNCDMCANYEYNEETGFYECLVSLDEDEMVQFLSGNFRGCPYYSPEEEYSIVRKQN